MFTFTHPDGVVVIKIYYQLGKEKNGFDPQIEPIYRRLHEHPFFSCLTYADNASQSLSLEPISNRNYFPSKLHFQLAIRGRKLSIHLLGE